MVSMSQATLATTPYVNSNLFSGFYLDDKVQLLEALEAKIKIVNPLLGK